MAELRNELNKKSDVDEEVKNEGLQAEHDRMLTLQQQTNQKLRDLEIARDEARSLLYASLTTKDGRSPELLQKLKEAMLQQIREQIHQVVKAPFEAQEKALEETSSDIADKVASSQAALDNVKRVSARQLLSDSRRAANENAARSPGLSSISACSKERSAAQDEVVAPAKSADEQTATEEVLSTTRISTTKRSTWGDKIARLISPSKSQSQLRDLDRPKYLPFVTAASAQGSLEQFILNMASSPCVWRLRS